MKKNILAAALVAVAATACAQAQGLVNKADAAANTAEKAADSAEKSAGAAEKDAAAATAEAKAAAEKADAAAKLAASLDDPVAVNAKLVDGALLIDVRPADAKDPLATARQIPAADWDKHQADFDKLTGGDKAKPVVLYDEDGAQAVAVRDKLKAAGHTAVWAQAKAAIVVTDARAKAASEVKDAAGGKKKKGK